MDCWIYKDGEIESPSITGGKLINLVQDGLLSRSSEIRPAAGGEWQTIESSEFREFLPGESPSIRAPTQPYLDRSSRLAIKALVFCLLCCVLGFAVGTLGRYLVVASLGFLAPAWPVATIGAAVFLVSANALVFGSPFALAWVVLRNKTLSARIFGTLAFALPVAGLTFFLPSLLQNLWTDEAVAGLVANDVDGALPDLEQFREISYSGDSGCSGLCASLLWAGRMDRVVILPSLGRNVGHPREPYDTANGRPTTTELTGTSYRVGAGDDCSNPPLRKGSDAERSRQYSEKLLKATAFFREGTCLVGEKSFARGLVVIRSRMSFYGAEQERRRTISGAYRSTVGKVVDGGVEWLRVKTVVWYSAKAPESFFWFKNVLDWPSFPKAVLKSSSEDIDSVGNDGPTERFMETLPHAAATSAAQRIDKQVLLDRLVPVSKANDSNVKVLIEALEADDAIADVAIRSLLTPAAVADVGRSNIVKTLKQFSAESLKRSAAELTEFYDRVSTESRGGELWDADAVLVKLGAAGISRLDPIMDDVSFWDGSMSGGAVPRFYSMSMAICHGGDPDLAPLLSKQTKLLIEANRKKPVSGNMAAGLVANYVYALVRVGRPAEAKHLVDAFSVSPAPVPNYSGERLTCGIEMANQALSGRSFPKDVCDTPWLWKNGVCKHVQ